MNKLEYFYANRDTYAVVLSEEELKKKEEELIQNEMASGIKEAMENFLKGSVYPYQL